MEPNPERTPDQDLNDNIWHRDIDGKVYINMQVATEEKLRGILHLLADCGRSFTIQYSTLGEDFYIFGDDLKITPHETPEDISEFINAKSMELATAEIICLELGRVINGPPTTELFTSS